MIQLFYIFAQTPDQVKAIVDEMSQKDFKWWFAAIFVILLGSGLMVFRWLIQQFQSQREANATLNEKLISYVQTDHSKSLLVMQQIQDSLENFTDAIKVFVEIENRRKYSTSTSTTTLVGEKTIIEKS